MIAPVTLLAFVPTALALNLTPGADMMFCFGQGLRGGWRAGLAGALGVSAGGMIHVTLAGLGLAALMQTLPWMFDLVRWLGVAYLLWLAYGALRDGALPDGVVAPLAARRSFWQGMMVNLGNPKVILFVLALIPQFIDPAQAVLPQFLVFGAILGLGGVAVNGSVGAFAGKIGARLLRDAALSRWLGRITAGIFGALALRLALLERG